uniref:Uncharacterized protein n=1 Tax=Octopus bimaculoides TaxID=37653 RepID=A0A0L8HM35_OCTBM
MKGGWDWGQLCKKKLKSLKSHVTVTHCRRFQDVHPLGENLESSSKFRGYIVIRNS